MAVCFFDLDSIIAHFLPFSAKPDLTHLFDKKFGNIFPEKEYPEINGLIRNILGEMRKRENFYELNTIAFLLELCILLNRDSKTLIPRFFTVPGHSVTAMEQLPPAVSYLQNHYSNRIHIKDLSELCHMSFRSFLRHFRKVYDLPPYEFLQELRLTMVCKDLKSISHAINYIADINGFNSLSTFNRQFKSKFNTSPSEWRRKYSELKSGII